MKREEGNNTDIKGLFKCNELYRILIENASDVIIFTKESKIIDCNNPAILMFDLPSKKEISGRFPFDYSPERQADGTLSQEKALQLISSATPNVPQFFNWRFHYSDGIPFETQVKLNSFQYENQLFLQFQIQLIALQEQTIINLQQRENNLFEDDTDHEAIFHKKAIIDRNDTSTGIVGIMNDITDLKKKKQVLIEAEEKYKRIFENIQDVYYQTNLSGIITDISPSIERFSKYRRSEVIGHPIENFYFNPEDRIKLIQEIQKKGEASDFELLLKGKDDQTVWTSVNSHFLFDKNGKVSGLEGSLRDLTERKLAEEKLKLSLSVLQATLDSTTDGILVVDLSGNISSYNKQFIIIFGISEDIFESRNDLAAINSIRNQIKNPDQFTSRIQYLYDHPELESIDLIELNDERVLERYSCPQRLDEIPIGRVWRYKDISIKNKAEKQIHLMAQTLNSIKECISIIDFDDRILYINEAFIRTYGFTSKELIGQNISLVRFNENDPKIDQKIHDLTNDSGWQGEIRNKRKDGSDFPISLSTTIVRNEMGEIFGIVGVAVDITESKQAENKLRESEERYRNLIETMPDGVYRSTPEGKFVEVNPAMVKILGYESKEQLLAIDITTQLYFNPEDRKSMTLMINPGELDVYPLKKKDGSSVWIEDHGWYIRDKKGNILFHEGISRDVTERKITETQLQKYSAELLGLNATKDKFFSLIAHDLKSPFNSISGLSEILKDEAENLDIKTIKQYAEIINSTSKNTFSLLENLLDWARIQQSEIPFRPASIQLKKIVLENIELMIEKAISKKINIINDIPEYLAIFADEDMLNTILRNLFSNALKFTSTNGKIEIKAVSRPNKIEISVQDNGTGIKRTDLGKIFSIGSDYSKRGTENEKGTGLGLLLCKEFVEKHGGKIWVESEEGIGSTFTFTLDNSETPNPKEK